MSGSATLALSSPTPRYWPGEDGPHAEERPIRRWRVLHACEIVAETAAVVEAQIQAGMRPSVLTPNGWYRPAAAALRAPASLSLVHEWQQVRRWRNRFVNEITDEWAEILHAHCFAAAMAGLRGRSPVVYDFASPVGSDLTTKPGAWLLSSLRVAEQFAVSHAAAVVVHGGCLRSEAMHRHADDVFLVPEPVVPADTAGFSPQERHGIRVFVSAGGHGDARNIGDVLQAFATLRSEIEDARLAIEIKASLLPRLIALVAQAGLADAVRLVAAGDGASAMAEADIVLALPPGDPAPSRTLIDAMAHGRAIVAADVPQNREVTPQGRGCIWYRPGDASDLAGRASFLARNPDFRRALACGGLAHLMATRSAKVVARMYDHVYRHAFERRHRGGMDPMRKLEMARANL